MTPFISFAKPRGFPLCMVALGATCFPFSAPSAQQAGEPRDVAPGAAVGAFALGDVDGDGTVDLATALRSDGMQLLVRDIGGGSLRVERGLDLDPSESGVSGLEPTAMELADLDGDGDLDLLEAVPSSRTIAWRPNLDGQGAFGEPQVIEPFLLVYIPSLRAADLDGDGDLDVAAATDTLGDLSWYENLDGAGTFGPEQPVGASLLWPDQVRVADIDGDGDLDLVSSSRQSFAANLVWMENVNGDGSDWLEHTVFAEASSLIDLQVADVDGDGDPDLLACVRRQSPGELPNGLVWFENLDGRGAYSAAQSAGSLVATTAVRAGDLDGDGDVDLVAVDSVLDRLVWLENRDGRGRFVQGGSVSLPGRGAYDLELLDADSDGDLDVIAVDVFGTVARYENLGGTPLAWRSEDVVGRAHQPRSVATADLDGDGAPELLAGSGLRRGLRWFQNRLAGDGDWPSERVPGPAVIIDHVVLADLDGDGRQDVLTASRTDERIAWNRNESGPAIFGGRRVLVDGFSFPSSLSAPDLDGDGDLDVLASSSIGDELVWIENLGGRGRFAPKVSVDPMAEDVADAVAADLDGDGDLDVLAALRTEDTVVWYENLGAATFGARREIATDALQASHVRVGDVDGDGDQDVIGIHASTSFNSRELVVYENLDGLGTFDVERQINLQVGEFYADLQIADLDGDGDLDLLAPLSQTCCGVDLLVLENVDGAGTFLPHSTYLSRNGANEAVVSDLNGDGVLDVILVDEAGNNLSWIPGPSLLLGSSGTRALPRRAR